VDTLLSRIGSVVGAIIGVAIVGGVLFAQCVYPFIRHSPSVTYTCADEQMSSLCRDSNTMAGFMARVCGSDQLTVTAKSLEAIIIGGEQGTSREPMGTGMTMKCGDVDMKWSVDQGQKIETIDEFRKAATNDKARLAVDLFEDWSTGLIDYDDARVQLMK